jgi:hypothetical protein
MKTWSLYIDIEGFSPIYAQNDLTAILLLCKLMRNLYIIGTQTYTSDDECLLIYQFGDGFVVTPEFEHEPYTAVSIAIALMRSMLLDNGIYHGIYGVARAAVSTGKMVDITGCYPDEIRNNLQDNYVPLSSGLMILNSVMGDALINAYKLAEACPKGPLLLLDEHFSITSKK